MKKLLFILCVSVLIIGCEKNKPSPGVGTESTVNQLDSLEGVYSATHNVGATVYPSFVTEITSSKAESNAIFFSNLNPVNDSIKATFSGDDFVIDAAFSSSTNVSYSGSGTIYDSIIVISLQTNVSNYRNNNYSININK